MFDKKASTHFPINELLASRWSGRAYDPDKFLSKEQKIILMEAARWSPSCFGDEPWRYIVCDKATDETTWDRALQCLSEKNQSWARFAPVLVIVSANRVFEHNGKENKWGRYDTGASAMSVCVQATEMNLMVHQMGGFDAGRTSDVFSIPEQFIPVSVMAIGYQLAKDKIPEELKERELAMRNRKPLGECFFEGQWGNPIS